MLNRTLITLLVLAMAALGNGHWASSAKAFALHTDGLNDVKDSYTALIDDPSCDEQRGDEVREEFHQTYPIAANGRVSLENLNGGVRITVSDRNEVQVNAIKRAYRQDRLNEVRIEVNSTADAIRIKTTYPDRDQNFTNEEKGRYNNPAVVDYSITVPRAARLESIDLVNGSLDIDGVEGGVNASSVNGRLAVRGLRGEARLNTVNGDLEAIFAQLDASKPLSLGSVNGSVVVVIPSDSNAVVRAETISGSIENEFGLDVEDGEYVGHSLYGQLGSGGPRIKLSNVNGEITIKHAQDGRPVSAAASLLSQKDKDKDKTKIYADNEVRMTHEEERELAEKVRRKVLTQVDAEKIRREVQPEAQRAAQHALRDAEREIQRAQREVSRETQRQIREQVRNEARGEGRGSGEGKRHGEGTDSGRVTERESKSFAVAGTARVNLGTYDGAIAVHGWDKPEVMYTATKHARDEQEIKDIRIETEQRGSAISIIAKSPQGDGSASLDVFVPRNADVHASSGDGSLRLQGVAGDLTLRTGDGSIEVVDSQGQVQANTGDGHISISNFEGQADARTGDGSIVLDGKFTNLAARTGDGEISLSVAPDSNFTIETNSEEVSNEGLTISEDVAPSRRAKRWKIGRGGNIFVLSNGGDGRIVLRPR